MRRKYLGIVLLSLSCNFFIGQTHIDSVYIDHYKTKKFDCFIFPKEYDDLIGEPRFTPSRMDIDISECILVAQIENINKNLVNQDGKRNPIIHDNLKKYKRQYFGYIDINGDRILFINFLWGKKIVSEDWKQKGIFVFNGGSYYWSIKINLDKNILFDLQVNGTA